MLRNVWHTWTLAFILGMNVTSIILGIFSVEREHALTVRLCQQLNEGISFTQQLAANDRKHRHDITGSQSFHAWLDDRTIISSKHIRERSLEAEHACD